MTKQERLNEAICEGWEAVSHLLATQRGLLKQYKAILALENKSKAEYIKHKKNRAICLDLGAKIETITKSLDKLMDVLEDLESIDIIDY